MKLDILKSFLFWCSIINVGIITTWTLSFIFAHEAIYSIHYKWFKIKKSRYNAIHYALLALYKVTILFFNIIPYIVLESIY